MRTVAKRMFFLILTCAMSPLSEWDLRIPSVWCFGGASVMLPAECLRLLLRSREVPSPSWT